MGLAAGRVGAPQTEPRISIISVRAIGHTRAAPQRVRRSQLGARSAARSACAEVELELQLEEEEEVEAKVEVEVGAKVE